MDRWLIIATLTFGIGMSVLGRHAAAAEAKMPAAGEVVRVEGDAVKVGLSTAFLRNGPKVGDPDSARFDESCSVELPLAVTVLGVFETTVVARYETGAKAPSVLSCPCGGVILFEAEGWQALKTLAREAERLQADKDRRKANVRALIPAAAPAKK